MNLNTKSHGKRSNIKGDLRGKNGKDDRINRNYGACSSTLNSNSSNDTDGDERLQKTFFAPSVPSVSENVPFLAECREQRSASDSGDNAQLNNENDFMDNRYNNRDTMSNPTVRGEGGGRRRAASESSVSPRVALKKFRSQSDKSHDSKPDFSAFCIGKFELKVKCPFLISPSLLPSLTLYPPSNPPPPLTSIPSHTLFVLHLFRGTSTLSISKERRVWEEMKKQGR